ncbi:MAG: DUF4252 domain-containing protein [Bryobacteraceae bacterium]
MKLTGILLAAAALPIFAQEIKLPANVEALASKAEETVDVTMDKSMLRFATKFLSDKDHDEAKAKKLIAGLDGIFIRSFEFGSTGAYSAADVEAIRAQLKGPGWGRIVGVKSKSGGENVDVYFKDAGNDRLGGIVIIAAEPKELTIVSIQGTLDLDQLAELGGKCGLLRMELGGRHGWRKL